MKNCLQFSISFQSQDLDGDWTEEQWEIIANDIYCSLDGINIKISVPLRNKWVDEYENEIIEKEITIEPLFHPTLL